MLEEIKDIYECYAILGKVKREQEKIYYWEQQKKLFEIFNSIISDWKYKKINIDQYFDTLLKFSKDGIPHTTCKKAPTGGNKNWTIENVHDITTKYLKDNQHLIYAFDNYGKGYNEYYPKDKKNGLIEVHDGWIELAKNRKANNSSICDIYLKFGNWNRLNENSTNQYLYLYIKKGTFLKETIDDLIEKLSSLMKKEHIYYNWRPFRIVWEDERGMTCFNLVTDDEYGISINRKGGLNSIDNLWTEIKTTTNNVYKK